MDKEELRINLEWCCTVSADQEYSHSIRQEAREIIKKLVKLGKEKGFTFTVVFDSSGIAHVEEKK